MDLVGEDDFEGEVDVDGTSEPVVDGFVEDEELDFPGGWLILVSVTHSS